jgi:Serine dehydrogenase proteinase
MSGSGVPEQFASSDTPPEVSLVPTNRARSPFSGPEVVTAAEHEVVVQESAEFVDKMSKSGLDGASWMLVTGKLMDADGMSPEERVMRSCLRVFGDPPTVEKRERTINLVLDSEGGSLDSAFKITMYLTRYAKELNVYVPQRATSASTLVALGARRIYLSKFGQLGPLDTQIPDPRDPRKLTSALDCYQSVDYVRNFGIETLFRVVDAMPRGIRLLDQLDKATQFAIGAIYPMLQGIKATDFGGWGRSLKIGEEYARLLMKVRGLDDERADDIARQLVYCYTHHRFPIDYDEARRIGLEAELMDDVAYRMSRPILVACANKSFIGFISRDEAKADTDGRRREEYADRLTEISRDSEELFQQECARLEEDVRKRVAQDFDDEAQKAARDRWSAVEKQRRAEVMSAIATQERPWREKLSLTPREVPADTPPESASSPPYGNPDTPARASTP